MKPQVSVAYQERELEILHRGDNERDDTDSPDTKTKDEIREGVSGFIVNRSPKATRNVAAVVFGFICDCSSTVTRHA